jgi:SAM-dependent methyltransferase
MVGNDLQKEDKMSESIKLNIGSGPNPMDGFISIDTIKFNNDIVVCNTAEPKWRFEKDSIVGLIDGEGIEIGKDYKERSFILPDNSVDEVHCSHMIEHLTAQERIHFINELYRVLKPKAKATIIAPHWASCRAYGDLTHQWPPVSEFWFYYLSKEWRATNAPHSTYNEDVDFECTWGYSMNPAIVTRNPEFQQYAMANFKEAITDLHATLVKRG